VVVIMVRQLATTEGVNKTTLLPTGQLWKAAAEVNSDLPEYWKLVRIGDVAKLLNGFAFRSSMFNERHGIPLVRIRDLGKDSTETLYEGPFDSRYIVRAGSLLIGMDGDFRCVEWNGKDALLNQRVCKLTINSDFLNPRFVLYGINRHLRAIQNATSSLTVTHISSKTIADIAFPLPPRREQDRIVAKIEELSQDLKTTRRALQNVMDLISRFRQSILAKAFRGELTERDPNDEPAEKLLERIKQERRKKWEEGLRAKGKDPRKYKYDEAEPIEPRRLEKLPKGWTWTTIGELTESTFYGPRFAKSEYRNEGVITIRTTDLSNKGQFALKDPPRVPLNKRQIEYFGLKAGDLLVARSGTIGKCGVFDFQGEPAIPSAYLIRFTLFKDLFPPRYVLHYLLSPYGQLLLREGATAITQANINAEKIRRFAIPLSPSAEMRRIVSMIESLLACADHIEEQVKLAANSAYLLEQSILSRAFRGELVPHDPNDEPASVLLGRIRTQCETMSKKDKSQKVLEFGATAKITSRA